MKGKRKFMGFVFVCSVYVFGCWLTQVAVVGGILVSLSLIFTGGNAVEHLGGKVSITPGT